MTAFSRKSRAALALTVIAAAWLGGPSRPRLRAQTEPPGLDETVLEAYRRAEPLTSWPLKKLFHEIPDLKGLEPAADQSALPNVLSAVANNVKAMLANFVNTTSLETIKETRTRNYPPSEDHVVQRFRYLMLLKQDGLTTDLVEYRTDLHGREESPDTGIRGFLKTTGFASMPLYFGPGRQSLSDFRYLGSQSIDGQQTDVVAFAEHPVPSSALGFILLPGGSIPAILQGVAWIDSSSDQIVRMRTDLLAPQLGARLDRETTEARFHEVRFAKASVSLWLPEEVDVTLGLQGLTYVNRHHYSDYQVFNVTTDQKVSNPKEAAQH
jgi:hypothetical protein